MTTDTTGVEQPSLKVRCRVEWMDTDASGHYHHGTVIRWVETAEAALLSQLGLSHLYGQIPRVHYEADYFRRVWFGDDVDLELAVERVGRSSVSMAFTASTAEAVVAAGRMVLVNAAADCSEAEPWSDDVRSALQGVSANGQAGFVQEP